MAVSALLGPRLALTACLLAALGACNSQTPTQSSGNPQTTPTQSAAGSIVVRYLGFVGQTLMASVPTACPTAACAVAPPAQSVIQPGTYSYPATPGTTYTIHGTMVGRPAPLTGPAFNVAADLSFDVNVTMAAVASSTRLGIAWDSIQLNGRPFDPRGAAGAGNCGVYFFSNTPEITIRWVYVFRVDSFPVTAQPGAFCA